MENQNSSHMQKKTKTTKKRVTVDPCPICNKELHLNDEFTQRVGLLGDFDEVIGWLCPHCKSEFDVNDHIVNLFGGEGMRGEA